LILDARITELVEKEKFEEAQWAKDEAVRAVYEIEHIMKTHPPDNWKIFR